MCGAGGGWMWGYDCGRGDWLAEMFSLSRTLWNINIRFGMALFKLISHRN